MQISNFGTQITSPADVKGKPFEAQYEQVVTRKLPDGQTSRQTMSGTIYRSADGHGRREARLELAPGMTVDIVFIHDPATQTVYLLDNSSKTVTKQLMPSSSQTSGVELLNKHTQAAPGTRYEELGVKQVEGLACKGYRVKGPGDSKTEYWVSEELQEVLIEERVSEQETSFWRLFNIRRVEPDSSLFTVPADYK